MLVCVGILFNYFLSLNKKYISTPSNALQVLKRCHRGRAKNTFSITSSSAKHAKNVQINLSLPRVQVCCVHAEQNFRILDFRCSFFVRFLFDPDCLIECHPLRGFLANRQRANATRTRIPGLHIQLTQLRANLSHPHTGQFV